ncbi:LytTR family transcriptional regulator [Sporosarcina sp. ANT_H38]|uniref:LytTR family DNA-binding domain-containing protein n=1 Tax=Sporosarcina sp. ANT_H38 TaxID=2597358 RepID=UPI0011F23EFD|nr:LytTR family DNA-binding domain-containing protein [Sporosarcina sp. ANT_H38]KAA0966879.1 LytTR family transcriptional regulator [Sporosarcina sp. ANT_H38]
MMKANVGIAKELLQQYAAILDDWIPKDAAVAIAVGDRYIYYVEGIHQIELKEGQPVMSGSIADKVISERLKVDKIMDNTLFGASYYGIGYPIDLQGQPGALIVILPPNYHVLKHEPFRFLTGKQEEEWSPIPIEEIAYIESLQKKTWFYVDGEQFCTSHTLKDLQLRLPKTFLRIHRSYIVNILAIERISRDITSNLLLTLRDGTELPVSQTYMADVKKALGF